MVKNLPASARDSGHMGMIPGLGRSPGVGNGNPLQYSFLQNPRTEEPGEVLSMGQKMVRHDWAHTHRHTHKHKQTKESYFLLLAFYTPCCDEILYIHAFEHLLIEFAFFHIYQEIFYFSNFSSNKCIKL